MSLLMQRVLVIAGLIVIIMALNGLARWFRRRRTEQIAAAAQTLGFSFEPEGDAEIAGVWLFNANLSAKKSNILRGGAAGLEAIVCDVEVWTGPANKQTSRNRHNLRQTIAAYRKPKLDLPQFQLWPGGKLTAFFSSVSRHIVKLDHSPEFTTHFVLSYGAEQRDEAAVAALFTPALVSGLNIPPHLRLEGWGEWLVFYRSGVTIAPEQLLDFVRETSESAAAFFGYC
jgi:hypothetical protein